MKLFRCWDSSATITKNEQFRNVTVSKEGELGGQEAAAMMLGALFGYSYTIWISWKQHFCLMISASSIRSNPASIDPSFQAERPSSSSSGATSAPALPNTQAKAKPRPKPKPAPKAKTASQEAKGVLWFWINVFPKMRALQFCSSLQVYPSSCVSLLGYDVGKFYDLGMPRLLGIWKTISGQAATHNLTKLYFDSIVTV